MIWNHRKRAAVLLPLLVTLLAPTVAPAQEPPKPLQPQPPRFLLGGVEPLLNDQMKVVELLSAQRWREARDLAHQQFHVVAGYADDDPAIAATGLVLEALADAGLGDDRLALCRWGVARKLDPNFTKADFSSFGRAGALLDGHLLQGPKGASPDPAARNYVEKAPERLGPDSGVQRPELLSTTRPVYTVAARKEKLEGKVIVESIIDREGHVLDPRLLKTQPKGLGLAALDAVCNWRFKPATLQGEPVKVYYVLTVSFEAGKTPVPPQP